MNFLVSDEIKLRMLKTLRDRKERTISSLRKELGAVNYNSVKKNCLFLKEIGLLEIEEKDVGTKKYVFVKISPIGEKIANKIK